MNPPPVSAVFLVVFDQRVGYTIAWSRSLPDISLDGVEYKSLPSGLHAVSEDLIYFRHAHHSGASIFIQSDADEEHRNANLAAVGVLVPLRDSVLGKVWEHAEELRDLAQWAVGNTQDSTRLEAFWERHRGDRRGEYSASAGNDNVNSGRKRKRGGSEATMPSFDPHGSWPKEHPALAVPELMHLFGPLMFPLQRAVLARKRVLFLGHAPVKKNSLAVWLAGVLGNVSRELGAVASQHLLRTHLLFNVGTHDIATLPGKEEHCGWLACTTDDILAEKRHLWDVLVRLPSQATGSRTWPTIHTSDGRVIKASQRDSRRWTLLLREMRRLRGQICAMYADDDDDERPLLERQNTRDETISAFDVYGRSQGEAVEAPTWTAVAYRGFMWWASAGEASAWDEDETKADEALLLDLPDRGAPSPASCRKVSGERDAEFARAAAILLVAYFRRVTERIIATLTSIVEEADDGADEGIDDGEIEIRGSDVREMGLDSWIGADSALLVQDMLEKWYGRSAVVVDEGLTLCGVRLC